MRRPLTLLLAVLAVSASVAASCGSGDTTGTGAAGTASDLEGAITVSGAASLSDAFTRIAEDFSAANPGVEVTLNVDSSSSLSTQILDGAPVDVFASADEATMAELADESLIAGEPETFATNELVIITKPGNPRGIAALADLADAGVIALCGEEVPCGRYAEEVLDGAGVDLDEASVTRGQNVGATLTAVADGDAVAGIVYVTDAKSAGDTVESVSIPAELNVVATYPIGVLEASGNREVAEAFLAYVMSDKGQAVLADHGFLPPP